MELVVVLTIISILSSVGVISYKGYHYRSRQSTTKHNLNAFITLADTYQANAGFVLPNMQKMNFPIKGAFEYSYKTICRDENGDPQYDGSKTMW